MKKRWKVLLCGYYGQGNLGDELLASAAISLLEKCGLHDDEMAILSGNPAESENSHGIAAVDRWDVRSLLKALASSETLLLGGGGIFQDTSSARSPWYYWGIMQAARLLGCRLWAVGQSIGPLNRRVSRRIASGAFSMCKAVSVRDRRSARFLKGNCILSDDLVLSLPESGAVSSRDTFLVNFRPTATGLEHRAAQALSKIELPLGMKMAGVALGKEDAALMKDLADAHGLSLDEVFTPTLEQIDDVFARGAGAFGMRLHFGVLCLRSAVPCTLVPYAPKVEDFAQRWGGQLWTEGVLAFPQEWRCFDELRTVRSRIESDFRACFEKVLDPRV
ncbi:MAG: polysaccharide pyruvyl transferase CsaB [Pyramidobacter sp.]|jgi:polysaccharide pyruvyl transferase CsaB